MPTNNTRITGTDPIYRDDRGKSNLIDHPVLAVVKDNIDALHNGRIRVYVANYGGIDPDDEKNWIWVSYMSPWFGIATKKQDAKNPENSKYGEYVGNPVSYGMWASAPDIGTEVVCIFINGRPDQGYYIGSPPQPGVHQMVPAIGSASEVVPNAKEAESYASAERLPVSEVNINDAGIRNSRSIYNEPKPVHSYQAAILDKQGLIRDKLRGTISSSSQRETPSRVFGISTPGGTIYDGGYTNKTIASAIKTADISKVQLAGRTGGHSIVMDDGTITGEDQLMRFRTAAGHTIMLNDSGQNIFIMHSNGLTWIELNKEGAIDIFSSNSFNVRTQGDLNLHADRDVNINAAKSLKMYAGDIKIESDATLSVKTGSSYVGDHGGKYSVRAAADMSLQSGGSSSVRSSGANYINGSEVRLNSGTGPSSDSVPVLDRTKFDDTIYSNRVGWMYPSPDPLLSVASRVTTHFPYKYANTGVNIKIDSDGTSLAQISGSASVQAAGNSVNPIPTNPIDQTIAATAGSTRSIISAGAAAKTLISGEIVSAAISQQAASAVNTVTSAVESTSPIPGALSGLTLNQAEQAGVFKPGSAATIAAKISDGLSVEQAGQLAVTGFNGIKTTTDLVNNVQNQIATIAQSMQSSVNNITNLSGTSSQITGLVSAASNYGPEAVNNLLASPGNAVTAVSTEISSSANKLSGIQSMISGGNFAAGLSNFSTSLQNKAKSTFDDLLGGLKSQAESAFLTAENSFIGLKAGVPNILGGGTAITTSTLADNFYQLSNASERSIELEQQLRTAKKEYRNNPTQENYNNIVTLENLYLNSTRTLNKMKSILFSTDSTGTFLQELNTVNNIGSTLTSSANLGLGNPIDILKKIDSLDSATALSGNLIENATQKLQSFGSSITNLSALTSKITDAVGSIGSQGGAIKIPAPATNTFNFSAITSKSAQLLGNSVIPIPTFDADTVSVDADQYLREQTVILSKINDLTIQQQLIEQQIGQVQLDLLDNATSIELLNSLNALKLKLDKIVTDLSNAQIEYQRLIS